MSIPKIIHSGLFGRKEYTPLESRCRESWRRVLPDFKFMDWNDQNGPGERRFFLEACKLRPINASDYIRFWALDEFGGIYLDNDVEVISPFDLEQAAFLGFQRDDTELDCVSTAVFGSHPSHHFVRCCRDEIDLAPSSVRPPWVAISVPTQILKNMGMVRSRNDQVVSGVRIYRKEIFHPWRWDELPHPVGPETIAIHHFGKTWDPNAP